MTLPLRRAASLLVFAMLSFSPASAQQDTSALQFRGFHAGASLDELAAVMRRSKGARLRCDRAKRDQRVSECRGAVSDSSIKAVKVWVSAIDSVAGVITLSAGMDSASLGRWRADLERRYGRVPVKTQGSQAMMQWVRRGRMLRLTWRTERGVPTASVSLVDGRVLDGWGGGSRARGSP
jgi:hypothetical protein